MIRTLQLLCLLVVIALDLRAGSILVVANKSDNTVDLVDTSTGESLKNIETGFAPHEAAASRDGRLVVISNYGNRDRPGSSLTVIDAKQMKPVRTIDLGAHSRPHGIAWIDAKRIAVTVEGSGSLLIVDVSDGVVEKDIATGQNVSHMVVVSRDAKRAFVANIGSGSVTVIDLASGEKVKDIATGKGAEGIAVTPDGTEVWVTNREADTISIIDAATYAVKATIPCPGFPIRVAVSGDGTYALVSAARSGEVVRFDVKTRKQLARRKLDLKNAPDAAKRLFGDRFGQSPVPVGLVISADGTEAFVAATQSDAVVVIDPATLEVKSLIKAGREPDGMAYAGAN